jgi:hypothetical protein
MAKDKENPRPRKSRLGLLLVLGVLAVAGLAVLAIGAYGEGSSPTKADQLTGKAKQGYEQFRDCMANEGVTVSPDGPPAESEKTDKMRAAFAKCGDLIHRGQGKEQGFADFRDCMAREGVTVSPDGPPAESEKTDKMRAAFAKCGDRIPADVRARETGGS